MIKEKKAKKIRSVVVKQDNSVDSLISQAITANANVETMEKLFSLREKMKAEKATEAFVVALGQFQAQCPTIEKTKKVMNKDGITVRYQFAPLDSIAKQIQKPLQNCGLSYSWDTKKNDKGSIIAVCTITHVLGHSQSSEFEIPIDTEGYMTAPQKVASALTFAKRYSLCNALGISTADEDTDATDVNKEKSAKSIKSKIMFALKNLGQNTSTKETCNASVLTLTNLQLNEQNYDEILDRLEILIDEKQNDKDIKI